MEINKLEENLLTTSQLGPLNLLRSNEEKLISYNTSIQEPQELNSKIYIRNK